MQETGLAYGKVKFFRELRPFQEYLDTLSRLLGDYDEYRVKCGNDGRPVSIAPYEFLRRYYPLSNADNIGVSFLENLISQSSSIIHNAQYHWEYGSKMAIEHIHEWTTFFKSTNQTKGYDESRSEYENRMSGLNANHKTQMREVCGYIEQGNHVLRQIMQMGTELSEPESEDMRISSEIQKMQQKLNTLMGQCTGKQAELTRLDKDTITLGQLKEEEKQEIAGLTEHKANLKREKETITTELQHLVTKYKEIIDYKKNEKTIREQLAEFNKLNTELPDLKARVRRLRVEEEKQLNINNAVKNQELNLRQNIIRLTQNIEIEKTNLDSLKASLGQVNNETVSLEELKRELTKEIDQINTRYLSSVGLTAYCLGLSRATLNNYQSILTALAKEYQRDATDGYIMMSLFWKTCFENILRSLVEERIRSSEEDKKDVCETHYEEIFVSLIEIGNIVTNSLSKFDMWRKKIHSPSDYDEVRAISRLWIGKVLDLYKAEGDAGLDRVLEQEVPSSLTKVVAKDSYAETFFVKPGLKMEAQTTGRKLGKSMFFVCLHAYLKKYGQHYS